MSMYTVALLILFSVALATDYAQATLEESNNLEIDQVYDVDVERADRHKRVTCDLLSFGGKVNHSACAAHCLARGKAGGRCNDGVCQCRKTKFKDLFN